MSEDTFKRKIEPICHIIPNVYAIAGASYLLAGQYFNSAGHSICWINAIPPTCINDPEVECIRGDEMASKYRFWFLGYSIFAIFVIITINMQLIVWSVFMQKKKSDQWRFGSSGATDNGGMCFPCRWSICSSRDISVAEKGGTSCAVIENNDVENPKHNLIPIEDCLQPVKSPKLSASLTTRPAGTTHKSRKESILKPSNNFTIDGAKDKEELRVASSPKPVSARRKTAPPASRAGTAEDPYAFDLRKVKAKLQQEDSIRRSSLPYTTLNRKVLFHEMEPTSSWRTSGQIKDGDFERREVILQSSIYVGAFVLTWIWPVVIL